MMDFTIATTIPLWYVLTAMLTYSHARQEQETRATSFINTARRTQQPRSVMSTWSTMDTHWNTVTDTDTDTEGTATADMDMDMVATVMVIVTVTVTVVTDTAVMVTEGMVGMVMVMVGTTNQEISLDPSKVWPGTEQSTVR